MSNGPERQGVLALNCTCARYSLDKGSTVDRPERLGSHVQVPSTLRHPTKNPRERARDIIIR